MIERIYHVDIYFSEDPNLEVGGLERELGVSPSFAGRREISLLGGPMSYYGIEYKGLEKSKALQIVKRFSGTEELNHIILNPVRKN